MCVCACVLCVCVGGGDFFYHLNVYSCYPLRSVIMQCTCACKQQLLAAVKDLDKLTLGLVYVCF